MVETLEEAINNDLILFSGTSLAVAAVTGNPTGIDFEVEGKCMVLFWS